MVIYEVNLFIDGEIFAEYFVWLKEHVKEMLEFPGFLEARILRPELNDSTDHTAITVQYNIECRHDLERYFNEYAERMREQGMKLFKDRFTAQRRILEVLETVQK